MPFTHFSAASVLFSYVATRFLFHFSALCLHTVFRALSSRSETRADVPASRFRGSALRCAAGIARSDSSDSSFCSHRREKKKGLAALRTLMNALWQESLGFRTRQPTSAKSPTVRGAFKPLWMDLSAAWGSHCLFTVNKKQTMSSLAQLTSPTTPDRRRRKKLRRTQAGVLRCL